MNKYLYLLTYTKQGSDYYRWFSTEKEMDDFIDSDAEINVKEGIHIKQCEVIRGFRRRN